MGILEEIGNYEYHCPQCDENLRAKEGIEFLTRNNKDKMRSIYLDPNLGKYEFYYDYSHDFEKNEKVDFFCPRCETNLKSTKHSDYVEIIMVVSEAVRFEVLFSSSSVPIWHGLTASLDRAFAVWPSHPSACCWLRNLREKNRSQYF